MIVNVQSVINLGLGLKVFGQRLIVAYPILVLSICVMTVNGGNEEEYTHTSGRDEDMPVERDRDTRWKARILGLTETTKSTPEEFV